MEKKKRWNIIKVVLKLGFTTLMGYLVFQKIDIRQVKSVFLNSDPVFLLFAFLSYFASQVVSSWRLLGFLDCIGLSLRFGFNMRLYLLGMFYNVFLPGGVGGDGYKIYLLRKKFQLPARQIFLALFLDRVSGLWAICLLATLLLFLLPSFPTRDWWPLIFAAGSLVYYGVYRLLFRTFVPNDLRGHSRAILVQCLQLFSVFLILSSQDFDGNYAPYLFSFLLSSLATVIPVSIGGLGIREYVIVYAAAFFGMDKALAVFTTLCFYILSTFAALTGSWFAYRSGEFERLPDEKEMKKSEKNEEAIIPATRETP